MFPHFGQGLGDKLVGSSHQFYLVFCLKKNHPLVTIS
jgi:hypothetical protein